MKNKKLYEEIMNDISIVLKKHLNNDNFTITINQFLNKIKDLSITELKKIFSNNLNESIETDKVRDLILSGNSKLGNVNYEKISNDIINCTYNILDNFMINGVNNIKFTDIIERYNIDEYYQMYIRKLKLYDIDFIDFIVPNEPNFLNEFINDIISCGFYYNSKDFIKTIQKEQYTKEQLDILNNLIFIRFLPINQNNIRYILETNTNNILYHYTYQENIESIKQDGLKINNISHPTYPKRLFFITNINNFNIDFKSYKSSVLTSLYFTYFEKYKKIPSFYEITINLNNLPKNINFYIDINSFPYAVYTTDNIDVKYLKINENPIYA